MGGKNKCNRLKATTGRYGGTYSHPDIAFEFGMWISPQYPHRRHQREPDTAKSDLTTGKSGLCLGSRHAQRRPFRNDRQGMERRQSRQEREYTGLCHIGTIGCFEQYGKYQRPAYPARTSAERATYPSEQNSDHTNEIADAK